MATLDQLKTHIEKAKTEFSDAIQKAEDNTPKHSQSYSDLFTNLYINKTKLKFDPIKAVALKQKDITELTDFFEKMENIFKNTTRK